MTTFFSFNCHFVKIKSVLMPEKSLGCLAYGLICLLIYK